MAKVHLGCGNQYFDGYINVDSDNTERVDIVADARSLPFKSNSVETIEAYHLSEHIPRQEIQEMFKEWQRILSPHGRVVVESPDFEQNCKDLVKAVEEGDWETSNMNMMAIYGGDTPSPQDAHRWGYNSKTIKGLLHLAGFSEIKETEPQSPHEDQAASFRVEAVKQDG